MIGKVSNHTERRGERPRPERPAALRRWSISDGRWQRAAHGGPAWERGPFGSHVHLRSRNGASLKYLGMPDRSANTNTSWAPRKQMSGTCQWAEPAPKTTLFPLVPTGFHWTPLVAWAGRMHSSEELGCDHAMTGMCRWKGGGGESHHAAHGDLFPGHPLPPTPLPPSLTTSAHTSILRMERRKGTKIHSLHASP